MAPIQQPLGDAKDPLVLLFSLLYEKDGLKTVSLGRKVKQQ